MATTITWDGSSSGDVNVAANWTPAQVPIDGDSIIVDSRSTQNMNASLSTFAAMKFPLFFVGPDATIGIGTAATDGNGLRFAATKLVNQGAGSFYYETADSGVNITDEMIVNSPNRELAMYVNSPANALIVEIRVTAGRVAFIGSTISAGDMFISFRNAIASDAIVEIPSTITMATGALHMNGGKVSIKLLPVDTYCTNGELTVTHDTGSSGSPLNLYISGSAKVIYNDTATITLAELRSGTLDLTQRSRELTITTLRRWPNTTLKTNELVTIDTTEDMTGGDI